MECLPGILRTEIPGNSVGKLLIFEIGINGIRDQILRPKVNWFWDTRTPLSRDNVTAGCCLDNE